MNGEWFTTATSLLAGVPLTLVITASTLLFSVLLGIGLSLLKTSGIKGLVLLTDGYLFVFRTVPVLVQLFLVYYGAGQFSFIRHSALWPYFRDPFWCAIIVLSLYQASYVCEVFRGGLRAVDNGMIEAGKSLGLSTIKIYRFIVFPLALRQALPAYSNEVGRAIQVTSLTSTITLAEVTGIARTIISKTYSVFPVITVAGMIYIAITLVATGIVYRLERRLTNYRHDKKSTSKPHKLRAKSSAP
ncbi:ABC transporter permease subunit [Pectobacterium polonicum]|uniref:ABC transporter permease n=1 Tax=Pectobacterium polonicum TaxID=2485124 RepID=UPI002B246704|nr:ABC transporter permease subunit [Pectobacterium polonicum]